MARTKPAAPIAQCHCGANGERIQYLPFDHLADDIREQESSIRTTELCHCNSCRHLTGQLWTSYYPGARPRSLSQTTKYPPASSNLTNVQRKPQLQNQRFFCSTCGCHMFRKIHDPERKRLDREMRLESPNYAYESLETAVDVFRWGIATGTMEGIAEHVTFSCNIFVGDTKDGGAASWHRELDPVSFKGPGPDYYTGGGGEWLRIPQVQTPTVPKAVGSDKLKAHCACKAVHFLINRPNDSSQTTSKPHPPDFLPDSLAQGNWHLHENKTKYLAGLCACRSCRLTSGFEIQSWAFIPISNIFLISPASASTPAQSTMLDPSNLPPSLKAYESSPGTRRSFCKTCGATVFMHRSGEEMIRVSVGLLSADEGARAESWLKWWTKGIGFEKGAESERPGEEGGNRNDFVVDFAESFAAWGGEGKG